MSCYCDIGVPAEFYVKKTRRARKKHKCYECYSEIKPGELYEDLRAKWEGEVTTVKTCQDCVALREAMDTMECFCWMHGSLLDDVQIQFEEATFPPALRFNLLRLVASHRKIISTKGHVDCGVYK